MPIYEYRCPNGHTFEVFQRMTDAPLETCQSCGAGPVQKILFPVAVHFKGSGFYSTDYGKGGRKEAGAKEADAGGSSTASDGGTAKGEGADAKPAKTDGGDAKKPSGD
jgi:putative FmdB family regulatory protein